MKAHLPLVPRALSIDQYLRRLGLLWLLPLAVLAMLLVATSIYQVHRERARELAVWAAHLAMEFDADLRARVHGLQAMAAWAQSEGQTPVSLSEWYAYAASYDRTFDTAVILVDDQRQMLRHSRVKAGVPLPQIPKPSGRSAYQDVLDTGLTQIGDPVPGPVLKTMVVPVCVSTQGASQVLMGLVPTRKLQDLLRQRRLPEGLQAVLIGSNGQVIAATADESDSMDLAQDGIRKAQAKTSLGHFNVVVIASPWAFYRTHIVLGGTLLLMVALILMIVALIIRRASQRLAQSVQSLLTEPSAQATPPGPMLAPITEIEDVRQELLRAAQAERGAEQAERGRIARELHDGLQQDIAALRLDLDWALNRAKAGQDAQEMIGQARTIVDRLNQEVRQVVQALRPASLETLGLNHALSTLADQAQAFGLQIELEVIDDEAVLEQIPPQIADAVYRIAQESLNNVRKHAQASFVYMALDVPDSSRLTLVVSDDGAGLPGSIDGQGNGLRGMAERAKALGATLDIRRGHDGDTTRGTTVTLTVPLEQPGSA